ncbi:MAG: hypothetical protein ABIH76_00145 [Candidatus Bathyarchaeota archaeon]
MSGKPEKCCRLNAEELKQKVTKFYEDGFLDAFFGDVIHPGWLKLTEELARLAKIERESLVLDNS